MKERVDQDKLLSNKDEEVKKLEGRLHNANSDKCSLQAKLATAEKDLQINKKSNELLKTKVRPNKKISVFQVTGLKIYGRVGTHISFNYFFFLKKILILCIYG